MLRFPTLELTVKCGGSGLYRFGLISIHALGLSTLLLFLIAARSCPIVVLMGFEKVVEMYGRIAIKGNKVKYKTEEDWGCSFSKLLVSPSVNLHITFPFFSLGICW